MDLTGKHILDVTCGGRSIWFNKEHPAAVYCDKREGDWEKDFGKRFPGHRECHVHPDVIADFTNLPFPDESFELVVFDPPHLKSLTETSWMVKQYGRLEANWREIFREGASECMRVLKPHGVLILKWCEVEVPTRELINAIGMEPLFGHKSGKKSNTHWLAFMKGV